ncbi:hypothetical protein [Methylocaldum sp. GT1BB]|uniref:hypothetical protein n=1 Tax=Methylocaldum sp. GT1BB TaxID=3438963 RepID=UPI003DA1B787
MYGNYWFNDYLDRIEFKVPEKAGGCSMVIAKVWEERKIGVQAFGIVDRDSVQSKRLWDLVWETNDDAFSKAYPFGDYVRVTLYWELENYLIEPDAIETHLALHQQGRICRRRDEVIRDLLDHINALIPHAAVNAALHYQGSGDCGDGYTEAKPREDVETKIEYDHRTRLREDGWERYRDYINKVETFDYPDSSLEKRLTGLLRRIHGKALLARIKKAANIRDDITYHLGAAIKRSGAIPSELTGYIDEFLSISYVGQESGP